LAVFVENLCTARTTVQRSFFSGSLFFSKALHYGGLVQSPESPEL
jgi:hypothetical protein